MTESEKAQLGQLYNANHDPQLLNKRTWAKNLCMEYNQLRWDEGRSARRFCRSCSASAARTR
ncbi:MAG: maltose acetyltransferase domain-containing protein [Butyricicoccaceae bacterium]